MPYQFTSNSYQANPWRADCGCAWWLLCQPSPKVSMATQKLFLESSVVRKRCLPHICVAELTSQVACRPITVRRKMPQSTRDQPPTANSTRPKTVIGTQCQRLIKVWNLSLRRSGTYGSRASAWLCNARPVMIQPACAQKPPSWGECGSPGLSEF